MPRLKPQAKHLSKARNCRKIVQKKLSNEHNSQKNTRINLIKNIDELSDNHINEIINYMNNLNKDNSIANKKRIELIKHINSLPDSQIEKLHSLLKTMVYRKGKNVGEILSPYLQKKAFEFVETGLYKQESTDR